MAAPRFNFKSFLVRLALAALLVFSTYNPLDPWSYYHWAIEPLLLDLNTFSIPKALVGVAVAIGWGVFLSATYRSLGMIGTVMTVLLFGLLIWWVIDIGWISLDRPNVMNWLILVVLTLLLAAGLSWSHLRRRLTGQYDVDEVDT